jgi:hypothetical protein
MFARLGDQRKYITHMSELPGSIVLPEVNDKLPGKSTTKGTLKNVTPNARERFVLRRNINVDSSDYVLLIDVLLNYLL